MSKRKFSWLNDIESIAFIDLLKCIDYGKSIRNIRRACFEEIIHKCPELMQCMQDGFTEDDMRYWLNKGQFPQHMFCPICKKVELHVSKWYVPKTCGSKECVKKSMLHTSQQTCLKLYGVKHVWSVPEVQKKCISTKVDLYGQGNNIEKQKQVLKETYGVEYTWQIPAVKEKSKMTNLQRRGCEYALQSKDVRKKCKDTIERHKQENPNYYQDIQHKAQETNVANGHDPNWNNPKQAKKTFIQHYGVDNNMKCEKGKQEYCRSIRKKYGKDYFVETEQFQQKHRSNYRMKTGYLHQAQNPEVQSKMKRRYSFEERTFDSLTEIAFYIWLKDNDKDFEYQPKISFTYEYDGNVFAYFPDFVVDGIFIEIKGDHFFRKDGTMFLPYRNKTWTDKQYSYMCDKYEAKHQCMIKNGVHILKSSECKQYIEYVNNKYGKGYLLQYKNKTCLAKS